MSFFFLISMTYPIYSVFFSKISIRYLIFRKFGRFGEVVFVLLSMFCFPGCCFFVYDKLKGGKRISCCFDLTNNVSGLVS